MCTSLRHKVSLLAGFWRCEAPDCEFVEYPTPRLLSPLLTLEALSAASFRVRRTTSNNLAVSRPSFLSLRSTVLGP